VYGAKANTKKADWYKIWEQLFGAASTATIVDHETHAPRKRILQQGFSDQAIRDTESSVIENTRTFCKIIVNLSQDATNLSSVLTEKDSDPGWGPSQNLSQLYGYLTYDIMGGMVFSTSFDMQTSEKNRPYLGISMDALRGLNTVSYIFRNPNAIVLTVWEQVGFMPLLLRLKLDKIFFKELNAGMERYKLYCAEQATIRTARQQEMKTRDVWSALMFAKDPLTGQSFTEKDLQSEAAIIISAASHPSRTTLCALTHYLIDHPACMDAIRAELQSTFSHADEIRSGPGLQKCHYLRACLRETLRLCPGIPGNPLRTVLKGGLTVDDNFFPEGTDIGLSTYAVHHAERYFPKPFSFIPERWLARPAGDLGPESTDYATKDSIAQANEAFAAFSTGPMGCLGKNIVYHQLMVIFARMAWQFDLRRGPPPAGYESKRMGRAIAQAMHGEYPQRDNFSAEGDGPWVQFRSRL